MSQAVESRTNIVCISLGVEMFPPESTEIAGRKMHDLAMALYIRYIKRDDVQDLEYSILCHHYALRRLLPHGHPIRYTSLNYLGLCLGDFYEKLNNADDKLELKFQGTIALLHREALSLRPLEHPDRLSAVSYLAVILFIRYRHWGNIEDLEQVIAINRDARDLFPPDHPNRLVSLSVFAAALCDRYERLPVGNDSDLEYSIALNRELLSFHPLGHPRRAYSLNNLACALKISYEYLGNVNDLEESLSLFREALNLRPIGHPDRSLSLNNLANRLRARYERLGNPKDIEDCISLYSEGLSLPSPGHHGRSMLLHNLANGYRSRYDHLEDSADLETSISLHRQALALRPPGHLNRAMSLNSLAISLASQYKRLGSANDIDECISLHREALALHPVGHPHHFFSLTNIANALGSRYERSKNPEDLEATISLRVEALSLQPAGDPRHSVSLSNLSSSLMDRYAYTSQPQDRDQAFLYYSKAASDSSSYIQHRLMAATNWVNSAHAHNHDSILSAYATLLQLINSSLIFRPNVEFQQKFLALANIRSLASDAASAAIAAGNLELAVEFLEQGRALLWSRVDAYKYPLERLRQVRGGKDLADHLESLGADLERLSLENSAVTMNEETSAGSAILDKKMTEYRVLSEEWELLVEKVREIEGFGSFLRPTPFHALQSAAAEGPVGLVNISEYRSDAIILINNRRPELVNLPEVSVPELRGQKCGSAKAIANTLAYLWDCIVSPIVDRLTELEVPRHSRIWWCPTGELCALPLHAAGRGKRNLHDLYVSSYTSTLSSLIRARSMNVQLPAAIPKLLVVGQPSTDLKRVEDEVNIVKKLRPETKVLFRSEADREAVIDSLKDYSWVHFACHGILGDNGQPFQASFKLHEEVDLQLHLLDLVRARLPNAELAFVSACHSAAGGLSTPDESIHLSAALQFCGFKSVVGTLWEMDDDDGPTIAEKFYEYMFRNPDKADFRDSARALNSAIKQMRKSGIPLTRLAMFVHIGA